MWTLPGKLLDSLLFYDPRGGLNFCFLALGKLSLMKPANPWAIPTAIVNHCSCLAQLIIGVRKWILLNPAALLLVLL